MHEHHVWMQKTRWLTRSCVLPGHRLQAEEAEEADVIRLQPLRVSMIQSVPSQGYSHQSEWVHEFCLVLDCCVVQHVLYNSTEGLAHCSSQH